MNTSLKNHDAEQTLVDMVDLVDIVSRVVFE